MQHFRWNYNLVEFSSKAFGSPGAPPVSCLALGKAGASVWGGNETCAWGRCGDLENGLFYYVVMVFWRNVLTLIACSYLFTSKSQLQRNNLLFIFLLLTYFKKRKWLNPGSLLLGYCQSKYLVSPVLIKRQQMEASLSTGAIPSAVGVVQKGSSCSSSSRGAFTLHLQLCSWKGQIYLQVALNTWIADNHLISFDPCPLHCSSLKAKCSEVWWGSLDPTQEIPLVGSHSNGCLKPKCN